MRLRYYDIVSNFGDQMSPWLIGHLLAAEGVQLKESGRTVDAPALVAQGSIMAHARAGDVVWGAGAWNQTEPVTRPLVITAVRGKLTWAKMRERGLPCPRVFGDPGIFISRFHRPQRVFLDSIVVVPHMHDSKLVPSLIKRWPRAAILDVRKGFNLEIVDAIAQANLVVTSSLHAAIVAESYGVACELHKAPSEPEFKYHDYLSATDRPFVSGHILDQVDQDIVQINLWRAFKQALDALGVERRA